MTFSTFAPTTVNEIDYWDALSNWTTLSIPNSATAVVAIPVITPFEPYELIIRMAESYKVSTAYLSGQELVNNGGLTVLNEMVVSATGSYNNAIPFAVATASRSATLTVGTLENDGNVAGIGQITVNGDLLNRGMLGGGYLAISANSFENAGVLRTVAENALRTLSAGDVTVSVGSGGFANLANGVLTGGTYYAGAGQSIDLNVNGPITTLAALVDVGGTQGGYLYGDVKTYGATGTSYVSIGSSLQTIASTGIFDVQEGSYTLGSTVTVQGLLLDTGSVLTASGLTVAAGGQVVCAGTSILSVSAGGSIVDNGIIMATLDQDETSSTVTIASPITGTGSLIIGPGMFPGFIVNVTLVLGAADSANVVFSDSMGVLQLIAPKSFTGSIAGFSAGDTLILSGIDQQSVTGLTYAGDSTHGVLTVHETDGTTLDIAFLGKHNASEFTLEAVAKPEIQSGLPILVPSLVINDLDGTSRAVTAAAAISAYDAGTLANGTIVTDNAANLASNLDRLQTLVAAGDVGTIVLTDLYAFNSFLAPPALTLTAGQVTLDSAALGEIAGAYTISVAGATAVQAELLAGTAHIASIAVSDSLADIGTQLDKLDSLAATGQVASIAVTDSAVSTLSLTASQFQADHVALGDMTGNFAVSVDASAANLALTGLNGHAVTVTFTGTASDYSVASTGDGIGLTVTDAGTGRASTDTLRGVNALHFSDFTAIVAQAPGSAGAVATGNIAELYGAVFGRVPDVGGLSFYQSYLTANPGTSLTAFAQWFLDSPEYANNLAHNYAQTTAGDAQFIGDSYQNLLHRTPDSSEINFYQKVIAPFVQNLTPGTAAYASGEAQAHALVLTYFSQSAEFFGDVQVTAQNPISAQHWLVLI